jgi:hypothetical protein
VKRISLLVLAALASLAVTAALGGASASASVFCKSATSICASGNSYGVGTKLSASLDNNVSFSWNNGVWSECTAGSISSEVTGAGGEGPVKVKDLSASLTSCTWPTTVTPGSWEASYTSSNNGKISKDSTSITIKSSGVNCVYRFPQQAGNMGIVGGTSGELFVNTEIFGSPGNSGLCMPNLMMVGGYDINSPAPLYVEDRGAPPIVLCKANEEHCSTPYSAGTSINASLKAGTSLVLTEAEGELLESCQAGSLTGKTLTAGGGTFEQVAAEFSAGTLGECEYAATLEGLNEGAVIKRSDVAGSGTVKIAGFKIKENVFGINSCVFQGEPTFKLNGGAPAELVATKAVLTASGFGCPSEALLTATYTLSAPNPLYLTAP